MIYRIDIQHFLTDMIDYFTRDELVYCHYVVISAAVRHGQRDTNVTKVNELYPTVEIVSAYSEYKDKKILEKMYFDLLKPDYDGDNWVANKLYSVFINPLERHFDIVIICDRTENDYIDALCKYMKKTYAIEIIDLNELFSKGRIGPIYIDRDEIRDKAVDIRRAAATDKYKDDLKSVDGRMRILKKMTKREKIAKLESLGIKVTNRDKNELDQLLIDEWVNPEED